MYLVKAHILIHFFTQPRKWNLLYSEKICNSTVQQFPEYRTVVYMYNNYVTMLKVLDTMQEGVNGVNWLAYNNGFLLS